MFVVIFLNPFASLTVVFSMLSALDVEWVGVENFLTKFLLYSSHRSLQTSPQEVLGCDILIG